MPGPVEENEDSAGLLQFNYAIILVVIKRNLKKTIFISAISVIIAFIFAKVSFTDTWQARSVLLRHKKNMSQQQDMPYLYQQLDLNTVLETIKLRRNLVEVIKKLKLETTPEKLFNQITIKKGRKSNMIHILVNDKSRKNAVDIANTTSDVFITSFVPIQNSSAEKIYKYYVKQRELTISNLRDAKKKSINFKEVNNLIDIESETSIKFNQLKELELKQIENEMLVNDLKTKLDGNKKVIKDLPEQVLKSSTIKTSVKKRIKDLNVDLTRLREKYTEQNPKVLKLKDQIAKLEKIKNQDEKNVVADQLTYGQNQIRQSLIIENNKYQSELKAAKKKQREYINAIDKIKNSLNYLSQVDKQYFVISRKIELYHELLKKIEHRIVESKTAMESNISDFEIIEYATTPQYPQSSKRKLFAIAIGFLTFMGTLVYFIGREILDFTIKTKFDIEKALQLDYMGCLPAKNSFNEKLFYSWFQIFFEKLKMKKDKFPGFIVFAGDKDKIGKTFVINEVIKNLSFQKKKILYINSTTTVSAKNKKYMINSFLYNNKSARLSYHKINARLDKAYFHINEKTFMTPLETKKIKDLIKSLSKYHNIIWELFPAETNIQLFTNISKCSDMTLFISCFKRSSLFSMKKIIKFLEEQNINNITCLLNRVDESYLNLSI